VFLFLIEATLGKYHKLRTFAPDNSVNDIKSILPQLEVHRIEGPHLVLDTHPKTCARLVAGFLGSSEYEDVVREPEKIEINDSYS